jgi:hypothetical protein
MRGGDQDLDPCPASRELLFGSPGVGSYPSEEV